MGLTDWLTVIGFGATIFGALLAWAARGNGRATRALIKEEAEHARELLAEIRATTERGDQRTQELLREIREGAERGDQHTQALIREVHQDTMRVLEKIAERVSR